MIDLPPVPESGHRPDPKDVSRVADRIAVLAAQRSALDHELLAYVRWFDSVNAWHEQGALSCA